MKCHQWQLWGSMTTYYHEKASTRALGCLIDRIINTGQNGKED